MSALLENRCDSSRRRVSQNSCQAERLLRQRAETLLATEIAFMPVKNGSQPSPIRDLDGFLAEVLEGDGAGTPTTQQRSLIPVQCSLLTADQERRLFLHMNSLKCKANALRSRINPRHPSQNRIEQIDAMLADAARIRNCLVERNLRLVLSIARKLSNSQTQFEELVSDGIPILMRSVELFDASRGFRFSTYVTHSVQRHLYRVIQRRQRDKRRFAATDDEILANVPESLDERPRQMLDHSRIVASIMGEARVDLDRREDLIIQRRFGLDGRPPQTLREIAGELGISKERVRQLQIRAMEKLQDIALSMNVDADLL